LTIAASSIFIGIMFIFGIGIKLLRLSPNFQSPNILYQKIKGKYIKKESTFDDPNNFFLILAYLAINLTIIVNFFTTD
jgi:hypothetical protein